MNNPKEQQVDRQKVLADVLKKQKDLDYLMSEMIGNLIDKDVYYAPIISMSRFISDFSVGTAGVRWMKNRLDIILNLFMFVELPVEQRRGIIKHEIGHYILRHLSGSRALKLEAAWCKYFPNRLHQMHAGINIVEDMEINGGYVPKNELPAWVQLPEKYGYPEGLLAEEYLAMLKNDRDKKDPDDVDKIPDDKKDDGGPKGNQPTPGQGQPGSGQPGGQLPVPGSPEDKSGELPGEGDPWGRFKAQLDSPGQYPGIGDVLPSQEDFDEADEILLGEILKDCKQKAQGNLPAGLERLLKKLRPPTIKWPKNFRNAVVSLVKTNRTISTWARPNRRNLPVAGQMYKSKPDCYYFQDTSGSMTDEELAITSSELYGMKRYFRKVFVIVIDAGIHSRYTFRNKIESLKGGGGSDFRPAFDAVHNDKPRKPPVIIMGTDGDISVPNECPPRWEIFWILSAGDRNVPYGKKIIMDRSPEIV
jgi:predicted metal-dependent peptidase